VRSLANLFTATALIEGGAGLCLVAEGFRVVPSVNPYWDRSGRTFEDVDGYRVVLQKGAWAG
jgi:prolyl oligopeptidase